MSSKPLSSIVPAILAPAAAWLLLAGAATAQTPAAPRMWVIHQEAARPGEVAQYEATAREFMAAVRRHKQVMPHFSIAAAFQGEDFLYTYVTPIQGFADIDAIVREFEALAQAMGAQAFGDLMRRGGATADFYREWVVIEPPDMGYQPANPRLAPEEVKYFRYDLYYVQPGREAEADALARQMAELVRRKGLTDGYRLFKVLLGQDLSLFTVQVGARDAQDLAALDQQVWKVLGDEGKDLMGRVLALCRRVEHRDAWLRMDLTTAAPAG